MELRERERERGREGGREGERDREREREGERGIITTVVSELYDPCMYSTHLF